MKPLLGALILARALDVTTTCIALKDYRLREGILPARTCPQVTAISAGAGVAQIYSLTRLEKDHPKLAKWMGYISLGVEAGIVGWNVGQIRKYR